MSSEKRMRMERVDLLVDRNMWNIFRLMTLDVHIIVIVLEYVR